MSPAPETTPTIQWGESGRVAAIDFPCGLLTSDDDRLVLTRPEAVALLRALLGDRRIRDDLGADLETYL